MSDTYFELPLVTRGQATVWVGLHLRIIVADGQPLRLEGAARDVTDRRRVEDALQQSDERYRQAFDENLAGIFVASPSGQIRSCNPAFVQICGFPSLADALGANLGALYPDSGLANLVERVRRDGAVRQHESTLCRVDGRVVPVIESLVGRFDADGELMSINGYVFDDSPRKDLEAQMRQSQKMEALGRLAGGVAHDFNNVLMVINGLSETVLAILETDSPVREDLEEILAAGRRAAGLTAQLLAFSRKRVLLPTTFDLDEAIGTMQPMLCRLLGADIALTVEPSPEPKWIVADRGQIEQVLLNLAANARDAMPQGGELRITATIELRAYEVGRDVLSTPEVVLRLADTGQGMSPDVLARLFEPYFTTKARGKGTGLGLSTVYAIVAESGGRITVESHRGVGTTFHVALPLALPPEFAHRRRPASVLRVRPRPRSRHPDGAGRRGRGAGAASRHEHPAARRLHRAVGRGRDLGDGPPARPRRADRSAADRRDHAGPQRPRAGPRRAGVPARRAGAVHVRCASSALAAPEHQIVAHGTAEHFGLAGRSGRTRAIGAGGIGGCRGRRRASRLRSAHRARTASGPASTCPTRRGR